MVQGSNRLNGINHRQQQQQKAATPALRRLGQSDKSKEARPDPEKKEQGLFS